MVTIEVDGVKLGGDDMRAARCALRKAQKAHDAEMERRSLAVDSAHVRAGYEVYRLAMWLSRDDEGHGLESLEPSDDCWDYAVKVDGYGGVIIKAETAQGTVDMAVGGNPIALLYSRGSHLLAFAVRLDSGARQWYTVGVASGAARWVEVPRIVNDAINVEWAHIVSKSKAA